MIEPRLFLCSGAKVPSEDPLLQGRVKVELDSIGSKANVKIRLENVAKVLGKHLSPRLVDFLEIAAYVYSADCATRRGTQWTDEHSTEPWSRDLAFVIPVRDCSFWASEKVRAMLEDLLTFLSNDRWFFNFVPLQKDRPEQQYLKLSESRDWPFYAPERVLMFSGGLDSLAGAVETAKSGGNLVLVSHRPVVTIDSRQRKLFGKLRSIFPKQLLHIPVWINKGPNLDRESTQRTRSFLYSALGTLVAHSIQAGGVRFFENGIVSLNFPVADEVLRSRASRTTHPITLQSLQSLCSAVVGADFAIDNPYRYQTKAEVVKVISDFGLPELIRNTCSCAHSIFKSKTQWHCGTCSQCIDRRFAIIASGLQAYDSESDYVSDVFVGPRKEGYERNIAADYVRHGVELANLAGLELATRFSTELSRAVRREVNRNESANRFVSMHKRHGETVARVLKQKIVERAVDIANRSLVPSSLLAIAIGIDAFGQEPPSEARAGGIRLPESDLARLAELVGTQLLDRIGNAPSRQRKKRTGKLDRREATLFAAISMDFKGMKYCVFLHERNLRPKWTDSGPADYLKSHEAGGKWRKGIQDEKCRATIRMRNFSDSQLREAFNRFLPDQFDEICAFLNSRNSRGASSPSAAPQHA